MTRFFIPNCEEDELSRTDSGYVSAASSGAVLPDVYLTCRHLKFLNAQLKQLEPEGAFDGFSFG